MHPSSTSSSSRPEQPPSGLPEGSPAGARSFWGWLARGLLAVLVGVLAIDLGARLASPFNLYHDWEHQQIDWKEQKFRKFSKERGVDVLIAGSSVVMSLNAQKLGKRAEARAFNGGIGGADPTANTAILSHMYLPLAKPKLVVYGVSARDLRDAGDPFKQPPFLSHKMRAILAEGWQDRLEVAIEDISYLFRVRRLARSFIRRGAMPKFTKIETDDYGSRKYPGANLVPSLKGRKEFPKDYEYRSRYNNYRIDFENGNARQLIDLIEQLRSQGIATILVNIPLSPAAMTLFDHPDQDYELYSETLRKIAHQTGVDLYDAHDELHLSNSDFSDADHMAASGNKKTEAYLAPIISRHLTTLAAPMRQAPEALPH